jgi:hypothetical protein
MSDWFTANILHSAGNKSNLAGRGSCNRVLIDVSYTALRVTCITISSPRNATIMLLKHIVSREALLAMMPLPHSKWG